VNMDRTHLLADPNLWTLMCLVKTKVDKSNRNFKSSLVGMFNLL
jgi:hypothetical protein